MMGSCGFFQALLPPPLIHMQITHQPISQNSPICRQESARMSLDAAQGRHSSFQKRCSNYSRHNGVLSIFENASDTGVNAHICIHEEDRIHSDAAFRCHCGSLCSVETGASQWQHSSASWNAIKLYEDGKLGEALQVIDGIVQQDIRAAFTIYSYLLKVSIRMKSLDHGKQVHCHIIKSGVDSNVIMGNILLDMYTECGSILDARKVFNKMQEHNLFSWTRLISIYVKQGQGKEALSLFRQMQKTDVVPDKMLFVVILKACTGLAAFEQGKEIHENIIRRGFESDVYVGSTLVDMYAKCGCIEGAHKVFKKICRPNIVSWNALIAGYVQQGLNEQALILYEQLQHEGLKPTTFTFVSAIKACASLTALDKGKQIHDEIIKSSSDSNIFVGSALVDMYAKCESIEDARKVFNRMQERDVVVWTAIIAGFSQQGYGKEALLLFEQMQREGIKPNKVTFISILKACSSLVSLSWGKQIHAYIVESRLESDLLVCSSLIDMYSKCGSIENAHQIFSRMHNRDVVSWNAMIAGYAQQGLGKNALTLFERMQKEGFEPNNITYVSIFKACACLSDLQYGKRVHAQIVGSCCESDVFVGSALVDMYVKCGSIKDAHKVFNKICNRDVFSWTAMISGYAQQGLAEEALTLFKQMQEQGVMPNEVTFLSVLSACDHAGLLEEGCFLLSPMYRVYGIEPANEHYACVVGLLGRAGCLDEAEESINKMPILSSDMVWMALLGACRSHGNLELGKRAFECIMKSKPECNEAHLLLSNILAAASRWEDVARIRKMMEDAGIEKEHEHSWIEIKNEVHAFSVADMTHPQSLS